MNIDLDHYETLEELEQDLISWIKEEDIYSFDRYLNKEDVLKIVQMLIRSNLEIKRLTELCNKYEEEHKTTFETWQKDIKENEQLRSIIKEVREYIQDRYDGEVLTHTFDKDNVKELLEILDKVEGDK